MAYKQRWSNFFNVIDANKSGDITMADAENGIKRFADWLQFQPGTPDYNNCSETYRHFLINFIKEVDTSKDGSVSKEEYDKAVEKVVANGKDGIPGWYRDSATLLFNTIDFNKNGQLSLDELRIYATNIDPNVKEESIINAYKWALATTGKELIDKEGLIELTWVWGSDPNPHPELDIIFGFWK